MVVTFEYELTVLPLLNLSPWSALNLHSPTAWVEAVASGKGVWEAAIATAAHRPRRKQSVRRSAVWITGDAGRSDCLRTCIR